MSTARTSSRHTAADYATWSGDWELHAGEAIAMTPSPFGRHGELLARMAVVLCNAIDAAGCNATVLAEVDWIVNDQTVVRPDLAVICEAAPVGHLTSAPAFIVEVLLESTRSRDLSFKQSLYASEGVGWYLTLDATNGKPPSEAAGSPLTLRRLCEPSSAVGPVANRPLPSIAAGNAASGYRPIAIDTPLTIALCPGCTIAPDLSRLIRQPSAEHKQ